MSLKTAEILIGKTAKSGRKIPNYLVREVIDGIPFYYTGYRSILNKRKIFDKPILFISFQSILKNLIGDGLKARIDRKQFYVFIGATGAHIDDSNDLCLDVAVFDKTKLTPDKIGNKYADVPADLVIEVDVNVELPDRKANLFDEYVMRKVRRLFVFGTKKIVWVFTKSKTVIVATPNAPWQIIDWNHDIELFPGIVFNIENYLQEEGIKHEEL